MHSAHSSSTSARQVSRPSKMRLERRLADMTVYEDYATQIDELAVPSKCECAECDHAREAAPLDEVTPVPSGSRPPIRSTAALRTAWREYRCAIERMVQLRVFG